MNKITLSSFFILFFTLSTVICSDGLSLKRKTFEEDVHDDTDMETPIFYSNEYYEYIAHVFNPLKDNATKEEVEGAILIGLAFTAQRLQPTHSPIVLLIEKQHVVIRTKEEDFIHKVCWIKKAALLDLLSSLKGYLQSPSLQTSHEQKLRSFLNIPSHHSFDSSVVDFVLKRAGVVPFHKKSSI